MTEPIDPKANQGEEGRKRRLELLDKIADNIEKRNFACSDNFDKAILTYASAGLGFSLILYRDFIPHAGMGVPLVLAISWVFFTAAILAVIVTYLITPKLLADQLTLAEKYLHQWDESSNRASSWEPIVTFATISAGVLFFLAVVSTVYVAITIGHGPVDPRDVGRQSALASGQCGPAIGSNKPETARPASK